jgi:carboxylesterase type B
MRIERYRALVDGSASNVPLMLFWHGGGFILGSPSNKLTAPDPSLFVEEQDVVYAMASYRLGPLGFAAHADRPDAPVNFGLHDQVLAMQLLSSWAPVLRTEERLTLVGSSAGAFSICFHLAFHSHLIRRAILQSTMCDFPFFHAREEGFDQMRRLGAALDCDSFECLQQVPAESLVRALPSKRGIIWTKGERWMPLIAPHDPTAPAHPTVGLGENKDIDILMGYTTDEGSLFVLNGFALYFPSDHVAGILQAAVGEQKFDRILTYFNTTHLSPVLATRLLSEHWHCSNHRSAARFNETGARSVRVYHFALEPSYVKFPLNQLKSHHGAEMHAVFPTPALLRTGGAANEAEIELSHELGAIWAWFHRSTDLAQEVTKHEFHMDGVLDDDDGFVGFPTIPAVVEFNVPFIRVRSAAPAYCALWDEVMVDQATGLSIVPNVDQDEPILSWALNAGLPRLVGKLPDRCIVLTFVVWWLALRLQS